MTKKRKEASPLYQNAMKNLGEQLREAALEEQLLKELKQDAEMMDAEIKKQAEALIFGTTAFVTNKRADELSKHIEDMEAKYTQLNQRNERLREFLNELKSIAEDYKNGHDENLDAIMGRFIELIDEITRELEGEK